MVQVCDLIITTSIEFYLYNTHKLAFAILLVALLISYELLAFDYYLAGQGADKLYQLMGYVQL